jgi:PPK2 family polyphosphate:nucleotide phosphotransferase
MERYLVKPGTKVDLSKWDPQDTSGFDGDKKDGLELLDQVNTELETLQELLYAEHKHKVLIVLQGMDTSGKDGTVRAVFEGVNPQGVRVVSFKVPTSKELEHDYLWRVHQETPGSGEIVIFNRSHYEDVLVVRVHKLVQEEEWRRRYDQINAFEQTLAEEGTTILKFFLNIDKDEQKKRLLERIATPSKQWKFNPGDLKERDLWNEYQKAYEDVLSRTSKDCAPWYIIPSNHNWIRNLAIAQTITGALKKLNMGYPPSAENLDQYRKALGE